MKWVVVVSEHQYYSTHLQVLQLVFRLGPHQSTPQHPHKPKPLELHCYPRRRALVDHIVHPQNLVYYIINVIVLKLDRNDGQTKLEENISKNVGSMANNWPKILK